MGWNIRNLDPFKINWFIFGTFCPPHCDWFRCLLLTFKILFNNHHHFLRDHSLKSRSSPIKNRIQETIPWFEALRRCGGSSKSLFSLPHLLTLQRVIFTSSCFFFLGLGRVNRGAMWSIRRALLNVVYCCCCCCCSSSSSELYNVLAHSLLSGDLEILS